MELKELTYQQLQEAPILVQQIYLASMMRGVIGGTLYERVIKEHPEYFPKEVEHRRKWDAIPQSVHDAYWEELWALERRVKTDMPPGKGILHWVEYPDEQEEWLAKHREYEEILKPMRKALHERFYKEYGIEYKGW